MTERITVRPAPSDGVGGCNNCDRYVTPDGGIEHRVWMIDLAHGPGFRLCDDCREELIGALAASKQDAPDRPERR